MNINNVMFLILTFFFYSTYSPATLAAFGFTPTRGEWDAWPEYCRARYSLLTQVKNTPFANEIPKSTALYWQKEMKGLFNHIHHACAGQTKYKRALLMPPGSKRDSAFEAAISGHRYTLRNSSNNNQWYAHFSLSLAQVYRGMNDYQTGMKYVTPMIEKYPDYEESYLVWALILRDQGKFDEAVDVLNQGMAATGGGSGQMHYFLGLTYLDTDQNAKALEHAREAYAMGYSLPGLERKLREKGVWKDSGDQAAN